MRLSAGRDCGVSMAASLSWASQPVAICGKHLCNAIATVPFEVEVFCSFVAILSHVVRGFCSLHSLTAWNQSEPDPRSSSGAGSLLGLELCCGKFSKLLSWLFPLLS